MNRICLIFVALIIAACDSGGDGSSCRVNCDGVSAPISVDAGDDIVVSEGGIVDLVGTASQNGSASLTYQWDQIDGLTVEITNAGLPAASFTAPFIAVDRETLVFRLTVTSSDGSSNSDTVEVAVEPAGAFVPMSVQSEAEFNDVIDSAQAVIVSSEMNVRAVAVVEGEIGRSRSDQSGNTDRIDMYVFSPPVTDVYTLSLCKGSQECSSGTVTDDYHLSLLDQNGVVLAQQPVGEERAQVFSARLNAGLPYYAVVTATTSPSESRIYRLTIISD